jgi:hypothetical protein
MRWALNVRAEKRKRSDGGIVSEMLKSGVWAAIIIYYLSC